MSAESLGGGAGDGVRPGRAMPGEGAGGSKNRTMGAGKERRWKVYCVVGGSPGRIKHFRQR